MRNQTGAFTKKHTPLIALVRFWPEIRFVHWWQLERPIPLGLYSRRESLEDFGQDQRQIVGSGSFAPFSDAIENGLFHFAEWQD
jgi:hypothetical protein